MVGLSDIDFSSLSRRRSYCELPAPVLRGIVIDRTAGKQRRREVRLMIDRKQAAIDLLEWSLNRREVRAAFERYVHPDYRQHNPTVPDGREGVISELGAWVAANPKLRYDIKQVIADGDRVVIFAHVTRNPEDRGNAVVDILRFEGDIIVEHWDVIQPVPAQMPHRNGMF
jgi:predicted SnoaL-like aldol condensation-catalyzing enzyme